MLIGGQYFKEGVAYFKVRRVIYMRFQNIFIVSCQMIVIAIIMIYSTVLYIPKLRVVFIILLFVYWFLMHFN